MPTIPGPTGLNFDHSNPAMITPQQLEDLKNFVAKNFNPKSKEESSTPMKFERFLEILNRLDKLYSLKECTMSIESNEIYIRDEKEVVAKLYTPDNCWVRWNLIEEKEYPESDNRFTETVREIDEAEPSCMVKPVLEDDDVPF